MAFSSGSGKGPMADINVTPLVDVMLVLLIIFIVTAPIMTYPIDVALPQRVINPPPVTKEPPPPIDLRIDATNQPELRIDSSNDSEYETTARVLAAAKNAQMMKINFVNQQ